MCLDCHGTSADVLAQLKQLQERKEYGFYQWNTTSVNHLLIAMSNHDGAECRDLAVDIMKEFIVWYKANRYDHYLPVYGVVRMYSTECLENIVKFVEENPDATDEEYGEFVNAETDRSDEVGREKDVDERRWRSAVRFWCGVGFCVLVGVVVCVRCV